MGILAHISGLSTAPIELKPEEIINTLLSAMHVSTTADIQNLEATLSGEGTV